MDIIGTGIGEILNGTGDADTIQALGGNDTVNAGAGNDIIYGGTGNDTLNGEDGDDTFIENEFTTPTDIFNGGAGTDTIELRAAPVPIQTIFGALTPHGLSGTGQMSSIERIVFASQAGQVVQATLSYGNWQAAGITQIIGGAGRDFLTIAVGALAGTYTMPDLPISGWDAPSLNAWEHVGDFVVLNSTGGPTVNVTLNALAGANFMQLIAGGQGNDVLNGSSNGDIINASLGADTVSAGDGNDAITIINNRAPNASGWNVPTQFSGAGGTWNGGNGTDVVSIGGAVNLQATLVSIEGIHLQAAFIPAVPNTALQEAAELMLDSAHIAMLPGNAFFTGAGRVIFALDDGASFSAAGYNIVAGSDIQFEIWTGAGNGISITGSAFGDRIELGIGNQSAAGGNGNDFIAFGNGTQTASGGAGADHFRIGLIGGTVTDFTLGEDKVDFSGTDIFNLERLYDLLSESGGSTQIGGTTIDGQYLMTLQGVSLASLSANDFILGVGDGGFDNEVGTGADELFFGQQNNDIYHGGGGADRFYGGGGIDQIFGEDGDDTIILDGAVGFGGTYDGGAGNDTLLLRRNAGSVAGGPQTDYVIFPGAPGTGLVGIERIVFGSSADYGLTLVTSTAAVFNEVVGGAGVDYLVLVAITPGTYTMPNFTLTNWTSGQDALILTLANGMTGDGTLNARNGISQALIGALGNDTLNGSDMADILWGRAGNDTLTGNGGADQLNGEAGNDRLVIGAGSDGSTINGGTETDTLAVTGSVSGLAGLTGIEAVELNGGANLTLTGSQFNTGLAANTLLSGSGSITVNMEAGFFFLSSQFSNAGGAAVTFVVNGTGGVDVIKAGLNNALTIQAGDGADQIRGSNLADTISGDGGNDKIMGLGGADLLTGGAGADQFRYLFASDSGINAGADQILDFLSGTDRLDFRILDANPLIAGRQALTFIGTGSFTNTGIGEVRWDDLGADLRVYVDLDGNGTSDMEMLLVGAGSQTLQASDFLF